VRRNGETNPVTIIVIIAVIAAGFYGYHVAPVYMDNLEAKGAVEQAFNVYWLEGDKNAKDKLLIRLNEKGVGNHLKVDENGVESWPTGLGVDPDNITIEEQDGKLTVRVTYDRVIQFDPLKKRKTFHIVAEKVGKKAK
jgi:hypothetical protein